MKLNYKDRGLNSFELSFPLLALELALSAFLF